MATLFYFEAKLKIGKEQKFLQFVNGPKGFAITKAKLGFISAEVGLSKDDAGQTTFHLWEKWERMEDFENYGPDPEGLPGAEFEKIFADCIDGAPRELVPAIMEI